MITLHHVTKYYPTPGGRKYVLKDVSLTVDTHCNIGVLGRNGAGKSTLLRLLGGIDYPNQGEVRIDGSISWVMGLGGGMQGSMTGRENVRFVCRIYGDTEQEIDRKVKFIKDFSDLGNYFDMPVKTYSSGMKARLTFAASMAFDFDTYIMDEIGAVGDKNFKDKSKAALQERKDKSHIIKVSHSMQELIQDCDVGLYLANGKIEVFDDIKDAVDAYNNNKVI